MALTGLGMLSCLGHDVVSGCAAIRAGVVRPASIVGSDVLDLDSGELVPVTGHPVRGVTEGFAFLGLWARMAEAAVQDLLTQTRLDARDPHLWQDCALVVVTPTLDLERFPLLEEPVDAAFLKDDLATTLLELTRLAIPPERVHAAPAGHAGVAAALRLTSRLLDEGAVKRCLVVAIDSYLEPDTLDWLSASRRLKHPDNPVGLMPGEAAAALLLESSRAVNERRARVEAWVQGVALGDTGRPCGMPRAPRDGIAVAELLASLLPRESGPFLGELVVDLNGEEWRARELGGALARVGPKAAGAKLVLPAESLGETGAASGAIGVCVATRAFAQGYARSHDSIVLSLAETGQMGGIRLVRPDGPGAARPRARG